MNNSLRFISTFTYTKVLLLLTWRKVSARKLLIARMQVAILNFLSIATVRTFDALTFKDENVTKAGFHSVRL